MFEDIHQERIIQILRINGPLDRKLINWIMYEKHKLEYSFKRGTYSPTNEEISKSLNSLKENKIISYNYQNNYYSITNQEYPKTCLKKILEEKIKIHWLDFSKYQLATI